jgi:regulatory protein
MNAPSLKARALKLLAQREQSRSELRRKLLPHARAACASGESADENDAGPCLDKLLDWLEANRFLSEARFVESRVHARSARFGNLRIQQELKQHGTPPDAATTAALKETELARAQAVWQRKFGAPPEPSASSTASERARQMRFLAGRGFSPETIQRVFRADDER